MRFIYACSRHQNVDIDYKKYERTFQRIKRGVLPKNPTKIKEIVDSFNEETILKTYGHTLHMEISYKFYDGAIETDDYSFCVFSSKANIGLITENIPVASRHILMDATFKICPTGPFKQLLIIYIRKQRNVSVKNLNEYTQTVRFCLFAFIQQFLAFSHYCLCTVCFCIFDTAF